MTQSIGEQLKQAREKRGLTLEQASQATHIRTHYLEALENDQRTALPSTVQGRGFLRLYADLLNLPVTALLAAWDGKDLPEEPPVIPASVPPPSDLPAGTTLPEANETVSSPGAMIYEPEPEEVAPIPIEYQINEAPAPTAGDGAESGSLDIFREIGGILRTQRETLGLSIIEVERYTRLRQHYVQALEDGRLDRLPSPVQGRGMLSNYAAFLNLDEEKLLLRFAEGLQARRIERLPKPEPTLFNARKRPARQASFWRRYLTPDLLFGVVVAVIILFFVLWTSARINTARATEVQPTPPGIAEMLLTPLNQTGTPGTPLPGSATKLAGASASSSNGTPSPTGPAPIGETATAPAEGAQQTVVSSEGTPIAPGITSTIPPINKDPLQVYIVSSQRAYLRVIADDKIKFLGRTVPGNAYAFSGTKRLELLTGNAAALQIFYNQKDLGVLGNEGQMAEFVFVPDGMFTPTAAFTPTPTATKPGTPTPLPSATPQASPTITPFIPTK